MPSHDYTPLIDTQERLAEEQRQREDEQRQREEVEKQRREELRQRGYRDLEESHDRVARLLETERQMTLQREMTEVAFGPAPTEPSKPMRVDPRFEVAGVVPESEHIKGAGDMQLTPMGTMYVRQNYEVAREQRQEEVHKRENDAPPSVEAEPAINRTTEVTDRLAETTDRQAEITDRKAESTDRDLARFLEQRARQHEGLERDRNEGGRDR